MIITEVKTMNGLLAELASYRQELARLKNEYAAAKEAFDDEMAATTANIKTFSELVAERESEIKEMAVEGYTQDGEKTRNQWVKIREQTVVDYDAAEAAEWAKTTGMALSLDKTAFTKLAKSGAADGIPAMVSKRPSATIATDLSEVTK